jgi:putative transposase
VISDDESVPAQRLRHYDYASPGAYYVTICSHRRASIFASRRAAREVETCWASLPSHFAIELDAFVAMPNHVHGILWLTRAGHARPLQMIIGSFKSAAARRINAPRDSPGAPVWQRGYYERVVRDERELAALREYVVANPAAWNADPENPHRTQTAVAAPWL